MTGTTSAELVAALSAIRSGIDEVLGMAKEDALTVAHRVGVKSFTTPWGPVTVAFKAGGPEVRINDETAFFQWVSENRPTEIEIPPQPEPRVRAAYRSAVLSKLVAVGGIPMDKDTGEVCEFAEVVNVPDGAEYITYPASKEQKIAKAQAANWVLDRSIELADGFRAVLEAGQ